MGWILERKEQAQFARNPLVGVLVELRFHPVLKVPTAIAEFQDRVRARLPVYQESQIQSVNLRPFGGIEIGQGKLFQFLSADGATTLTLTTANLVLEVRRYESRTHLVAELRPTLDALGAIYSPRLTRVGLRYVNLIEKEKITHELGRAVSWSDLISKNFIDVPGALASLDETLFASEVVSSLPKGGMTIRHGLLRHPGDRPPDEQRVKFQFDADRYLDGARELAEVPGLLTDFSDDVFAAFSSAAGPALLSWMRNEQ